MFTWCSSLLRMGRFVLRILTSRSSSSVDTQNPPRWTSERVFRTFGGGFTESAGIGNRNWTHERDNPGCNHERHEPATPTTRPFACEPVVNPKVGARQNPHANKFYNSP